MVEGLLCEHWLQDDGTSRIHIYVDSKKQGKPSDLFKLKAYAVACR